MFGTLGLKSRALRCPDSPRLSIVQKFAPQISLPTWSNPLAVVRLNRLALRGVGVALVFATASCDRVNTTGIAEDSQVAAVTVYPEAVALPAGRTQQVSASAVDEEGDPVLGVQYSWNSTNSSVATVTSGVIKAVSSGTAYIRAVAGSHVDSVAVTVMTPQSNSPPILTTIALNPIATSLTVGASQAFTAVAKDQNDNVMSGVSFIWSTSNPSIMSVSNGVVTALAVGLAMVNVSSDGVNASAQVTVTTSAPISGAFSPPDIAFTDMEDGTTGEFTTTSGSTTGNADIVIMNDPTGQFGGNVARVHFARISTIASPDVNRALRYVHSSGIGLGQTIFLRGHVLIPRPAANMAAAQRKLFYVQRQQNDASFFFIKAEGSTTNGQPLKVALTNQKVFHAGTIAFDRKTSIEIQITNNSALGAADGVLRVWVDGNLVLDKPGLEFLLTSAPFVRFMYGQQTQHQLVDKSILFDEYRYWDNLALSTRRIGP